MADCDCWDYSSPCSSCEASLEAAHRSRHHQKAPPNEVDISAFEADVVVLRPDTILPIQRTLLSWMADGMDGCSTGHRRTSLRGTSLAGVRVYRNRKVGEGSISARLPNRCRIRSLELPVHHTASLGLVERRFVGMGLAVVVRHAPSRSRDVDDRLHLWLLMHCWAFDRVVFLRSRIERCREVQQEQLQFERRQWSYRRKACPLEELDVLPGSRVEDGQVERLLE